MPHAAILWLLAWAVLAFAEAPSLIAEVLPRAELPLGRAELPEVRATRIVRSGVTHIHIERGYHLEGGNWAIFSGFLEDEAVIVNARRCLEKVGLEVEGHRFEDPLGGVAYTALSLGSFNAAAEATEVLAKLDFQERLHVRHKASFEDWVTGPWTLDIVVIDPKLYRGRLISARGLGLATVSEIAKGNNAVVAINAGFFNGYTPTGFEPDKLPYSSGTSIIEGEWYHEPDDGPVIFIENSSAGPKVWIEQPHIAPGLPVLTWLASGRKATLAGINRRPERDDLVAMRPDIFAYAGRVEPIADSVLALRLNKEGTLATLEPKRGQSLPLPPGDLVLLATGKWREPLEVALAAGERLQLDLRVPGRPSLNAFRGVPILIHNGQRVVDGRRDLRTARTAVGVDGEGNIYLIVVDGNQHEKPTDRALGSVGVKLSELGELMAYLGCTEAINLDGGGSSVMVIDGDVVSHPYDVATQRVVERRILDALLLVD